jgi:hypothetical protein
VKLSKCIKNTHLTSSLTLFPTSKAFGTEYGMIR